jgi:purine-binding chemotaxis protein CheW
MDFLRIREKARERAARAGGEGVDPSTEEAGAAAPAGETAPGAREDAAPPAPQAPEEPPRFATWRPGSGAPPPVPPAPPPSAPPVDVADFAVVRGGAEARSGWPASPARSPEVPPTPAPPREPLEEFFFGPDEDLPPIEGLGPPPAAEASAPEPLESAVREEYLTFLLGSEEYAVAIERVREVLKCPPVTEVPRAPAHILGVVTVRGEVVAVFDPRQRLALPGGPPPDAAGRLVIVDAGDGPCGLLVDAVASVVRLLPGSIEPCPQGIGGANADCLAGIGREDDRLFTVLDLGALLRRAPAAVRRAAEGRGNAGS